MAVPRPPRRRERFIAVALEVAMLQPRHEDARKPRHTAVWIAVAVGDMRAPRQDRRIGPREQPGERIETHRIERLHHRHGSDIDYRVASIIGVCRTVQPYAASRSYGESCI